MTNGFSPLRLLALILFSVLLLVVEQGAVAAPQIKPVYVELPEITVGLNHEYQVIVQVTLRLPGPLAEQQVRDNIPKLRHALVLQMSDVNPYELDVPTLDSIADGYVLAANQSLGGNKLVKAAFLQTFVVQPK